MNRFCFFVEPVTCVCLSRNMGNVFHSVRDECVIDFMVDILDYMNCW